MILFSLFIPEDKIYNFHDCRTRTFFTGKKKVSCSPFSACKELGFRAPPNAGQAGELSLLRLCSVGGLTHFSPSNNFQCFPLLALASRAKGARILSRDGTQSTYLHYQSGRQPQKRDRETQVELNLMTPTFYQHPSHSLLFPVTNLRLNHFNKLFFIRKVKNIA